MNSKSEVIHQQNELLDLIRKDPTHRNYWDVYKRIKKLDFSNEDKTERNSSVNTISGKSIDSFFLNGQIIFINCCIDLLYMIYPIYPIR